MTFLRETLMWNSSDYLHPRFTSLLAHGKIQTIVELGARDGFDALLLRDFYGAKVHTFECNPDVLPRCRALLSREANITLVEKAAWDEEKPIAFYPVVETIEDERNIDNNPGASSCFPARSDYRQLYKQKQTTVSAVRLDSYCKSQGIEQIDLLCIDIQGAAFEALRGLGAMLRNTRYIIVELETKPMYFGEHLFEDVDQFLQGQGFNQIAQVNRDAWFSDYLYEGESK